MKIVYLHGLAGSPEDFENVAALINCRHVAPKIPFLEGSHSCLAQLSQDIHAGLPQEFKTPDTWVVGNSLGGALATMMGDVFHKIVLVAPHLKTVTGPLGRSQQAFTRELSKIFHDTERISPEQLERYKGMWREVTRCRKKFKALRMAKTMAESFRPSNFWPVIQDRLTLVCGRHDRISPLSDFLDIKRQMPAIRLHVLEDCGHAVPLEQPERLARILLQEKNGQA